MSDKNAAEVGRMAKAHAKDELLQPTIDDEKGSIFPQQARRNDPVIWLCTILCVIIWGAILVAGMIITILYLVYKPTFPGFELSSATLNSIYLDSGTRLNADLTFLVNFTNHNRGVEMGFDILYFDLHFQSHLIAMRAVDTFPIGKGQSVLQTVHFVSSEVNIQPQDGTELDRERRANRVAFEFVASFRTAYRLGRIGPIYRWIHWHCNVVFSDAPDGTLVYRSCTKR